ncbi:MAG: hypothetical protein KF774_04215 [Planctomyces sp.]|nr:hypothetical protein [Planctomyces sp.]
MMTVRRTLALAAAAMLISIADSAAAGFISTDLELPLASESVSTGTGSAVPSDDSLPRRLSVFLDDRPLNQSSIDFPLTGSSNGMGSQHVPGNSPATPAASAADGFHRDRAPELSWGSVVETELTLPSPLATRLFRPPRV